MRDLRPSFEQENLVREKITLKRRAANGNALATPVLKRAKSLPLNSLSQNLELNPGEYEIILVVDTMEQTGSRRDKGVIQVGSNLPAPFQTNKGNAVELGRAMCGPKASPR